MIDLSMYDNYNEIEFRNIMDDTITDEDMLPSDECDRIKIGYNFCHILARCKLLAFIIEKMFRVKSDIIEFVTDTKFNIISDTITTISKDIATTSDTININNDTIIITNNCVTNERNITINSDTLYINDIDIISFINNTNTTIAELKAAQSVGGE